VGGGGKADPLCGKNPNLKERVAERVKGRYYAGWGKGWDNLGELKN